MKKLFLIPVILALISGCASNIPPQPINLSVSAPNGTSVEKSDESQPQISKSMSVENDELTFKKCRVFGDTAYITIMGIGGWGSTGNELWNDFQLVRLKGLKRVKTFMLSGGGEIYNGLSIADEERLLKKDGVILEMDARGLIASAAVPIYVSGTKGKRTASKNTTFLLHPAKLIKIYAAESLDDIQSQAKMIKMMNDAYVSILVENSNLSDEQVRSMIEKDTWITAEEALEYGFVDEIR